MKNLLQNIQGNHIPSDMLAHLKKITNTRAGREMIKEMGEKGINQEMIQKLLEKKETIQVLVMRPNGIVKKRTVTYNDECPSLLHATLPTKYIKEDYEVWYDAHVKTINRKATKWLGFNVGGMVIIMGSDLDIF